MESRRARLAVVGRGRLGPALTRALRSAEWPVNGPLGRDFTIEDDHDAVVLCVPDEQLAAASASIPARPGLLVGHCSGATALAGLHGGHETFSLHPLMTVPRTGATFTGATAAVNGSTPRALGLATALADAMGMHTVQVADEDRTAYHAAASVASNLLLVVEDLAERLACSAGLPRDRLLPLVRATVDNWATTGAARALTGPVARGDAATLARQREAVADRCPEDLDLFDALVSGARRLAAREVA